MNVNKDKDRKIKSRPGFEFWNKKNTFLLRTQRCFSNSSSKQGTRHSMATAGKRRREPSPGATASAQASNGGSAGGIGTGIGAGAGLPLGEALVQVLTDAVLERIRGDVFDKVDLSDTITRGVKAFDVKMATQSVAKAAMKLHELKEERGSIKAKRDESIAESAEHLAEHAAVISAFFERSGNRDQKLRNPQDPSRGLYISAGTRTEKPRKVGIRVFSAVARTAITESIGELRTITDLASLMKAKDALLQHINLQISALPPVVKETPPKLHHNPGRARKDGEEEDAAGAGGAYDDEDEDEEDEDDE